MRGRRLAVAVAIALAAVSSFSARAEKADREKPTQVEANRMTSDEARRISIFEGNVVLSKGTMQLRAERVVVRQDADGCLFATATGNPVRFRQKSDPRGGQEGAWIEADSPSQSASRPSMSNTMRSSMPCARAAARTASAASSTNRVSGPATR